MIEFAVRRRIATSMLFLAIALAGMLSAQRLPVDLFPELEIPRVHALTFYAGAAPEEMETLVTRPLEEALSSVNGLRSIRSRSEEGLSIIEAQLEWGVSAELSMIQMRQKADIARQTMPEAASRTVLLRFDPAQRPLMLLAARAHGIDQRRLRQFLEVEVRPLLERVAGVASVLPLGGERREIQVDADAARLHAHGLTLRDIDSAIGAATFQGPAGFLQRGEREMAIRLDGELRHVDDIASLVIKSEGPMLRIGDVADVSDGYREARSAALLNGESAVLLAIRKESGKNAIETAQQVRNALPQINARFAHSIGLSVLDDQSQYIDQAVHNAASAAVMGALIALLVLLVFLDDSRSAVIIAASIPVSILASFAAMDAFGLSLNLISLGGLAVGAGMLVDNSIVALESIDRQRRENPTWTATQCAVAGVRRIASSAIASTLTSVIVFLPVVFLSGLAAAIFRDLALTVVIALLASLLCALLLTPALSTIIATDHKSRALHWIEVRLAGPRRIATRCTEWLENSSERALRLSLQRPRQSAMIAAAIVFIGGGGFFLLPARLFPEADRGEVLARLSLPAGATLDQSIEFHKRLHKALRQIHPQNQIVSIVGAEDDDLDALVRGESRLRDSRTRIWLASDVGRSREYIATLNQSLNTAGAIERDLSAQSDPLADLLGDSDTMALAVSAHDRMTARRLIEMARDQLKGRGLFRVLRSTTELGAPEIALRVDRFRTAALGLTPRDVGAALSGALRGNVSGEIRDGDRETPIRVRFRSEDRRSLDALARSHVSVADNQVALHSLIDDQRRRRPQAVLRVEQRRVEQLIAAPTPGREDEAYAALREATLRLRQAPQKPDLSETPEVTLQALNQETLDSLQQLAFAFLLSLALIYMLLAAQFESLLHPLTLGLAAPLTFAGAGIALWISGAGLNVASGMGMIMLAGLSVNAAIALFEEIESRRPAAVRIADRAALPTILCDSLRARLRAILLTTLTTVLGLAPMALAIGEGAELQAPMAIAVIGGLLASSLLTLVAFPTLYFRVELWRASR